MKGASHHCSAAWACYLTASSRQSLVSTSHDFPLPPPQPNGKPAQSEFEALKWNYKLPKGFYTRWCLYHTTRSTAARFGSCRSVWSVTQPSVMLHIWCQTFLPNMEH